MDYRLRYRFAHLGQTDSAGFNGALDSNSDYTAYIEEPDKVTFSFGQMDSNNVDQLDSTGIDKGVSSTLTVFGKGYEYVKHWLIDHSNASINSIKVEIYDMLCGKSMGIWEMKADNLQWCVDEECKLDVNLNEYTPVGNCLKNTLVKDNHRNWFPDDGVPGGKWDQVALINNADYIHPTYRYCDDVKPQFIQNFIFAVAHGLVISLNMLVWPIIAILDVMDAICSPLGIPFTADEDFDNTLNDFYEDIFSKLLGCERMHPAPFVRNYFINACSKCGVAFESNIFNEPDPASEHGGRYYNTCHMFAPISWGLRDKQVWDDKKNWLPKNAVNDSLLVYAYSLKDMFNAKFKLENGVFSFHTKNKFPTHIVFDFTTEEHKRLMISPLCYGWNAQKKYASTKFELAQDVKDLAGDEARHRYDGTKDWTESLSDTNKKFFEGIKEIKADQFGAARFAVDGVDQKLAFKKLNDEDFFPHDVLLMDKDVCQLGKLLIWDGVSEYKDAKVIKVTAHLAYKIWWRDDWIFNNIDWSYSIYNYPLFFDWKTNDGTIDTTILQEHKNLFELHKIDDPSKNGIQNKTWNTTMELCCAALNTLVYDDTSQDGLMAHLDYLVKLNDTEKGCIRRIEIDYDKNEIRLAGELKYT